MAKENKSKLRFVNTLLRRFGLKFVHHVDDPLLNDLSTLHERLRLIPAKDSRREEAVDAFRFLQHLFVLIRNLNIDLVIDVGANYGQFASLIRKIGFKGVVISFEPDPDAYRVLCESCPQSDNQINVNALVGNEHKQVDFQISTSSVFNSLRSISETGKALFWEFMEHKKTVSVEMNRLDAWLGELIGPTQSSRVLLKTDTQGFDLEVLAGASDTISKSVAVVIELPFRNIYSNAPTRDEIFAAMDSHSFVPSGFFPVSRIGESAGLLEVDAVFVRES